ncbi:outer membrane beta-barrel protein [Adhaeribacter radiodurans]|uniref:Outer membrane beta-barrel protein n=1 Tax=Adhaeribacter radiodurans TaxID=2745197 RepID=A0A7L7LDM9_9BACT|nr:outer membrane beta-barrel protein [Adhaeribacter radiodurans]QMU30883.1 outer membrane beta-barrel protein [Adhaeribacter radiodurans]
MQKFLLLLICSLSFFPIYAQRLAVFGSVQSAADKSFLPGATVILTKETDSVPIMGGTTDVEGKFRLEPVTPGKYMLRVQFIGFYPLAKSIEIGQTSLNMGTLAIQEEAVTLSAVEIIGRTPPGELKGDTAQFNAAAFKTAADASAQDLVQKMPGIMIQDGAIQAQGENVQQILIDGKPFFGTDVNTALQNLPADVIANIQVFDKKSDKAELSGFDDGERIKTINIVTKPTRKIGRFGRVSGGYGSDNRYLAGASVNFFSDDRRITVTGLGNNINTLNFSADPNSGDQRPQNGIITSNAIGLNYANKWGKKIDVSGSYFYNNRRNLTTQNRYRDYIIPTDVEQASADSGQVYTENSRSRNVDANHRFAMRLEYKIDDRNRILFRPNLNLQNYDYNSYFLGRTDYDLGILNQTENQSNGDQLNGDFNNTLLYSHRFLKEGRSITFNVRSGYHTDGGDSYRLATNTFYNPDSSQTLNQYTNLDRKGFNWEGEVSYTEPIGKNGQVELEYEIGNRLNDSDKRTYDYLEQLGDFSLLSPGLSNTFNNAYLTQEAEAGYRYNTEKIRLQVEASYQQATLRNEQEYPSVYNINRTFESILPNARLEYRFSKSNNIQLNYRASTSAPSINQLQDVIDYSNPLQVRRGNTDLQQSYQNWLRLEYRAHNPETNKSFYANVQGTFIQDYITNSTLIVREPLQLNESVTLGRGAQLIRPVNLNGYYDVRSYFSYGQPVTFISSNVNVNGSIGRTRRPGLIDNDQNIANTSNFRLGLSVSSNISENLDFTVSTNSRYNIVKNTLRPNMNNNYFMQNTRLRFNWVFWRGFVYRTDLNHQANAGLSDISNNFLLWNMSVGKKIFANKRGEINLSVYDLLKQNNSIWRNISDAYVEDVQTNVLQRYFMLTFTYNIRYFGVGASEKDFENKNSNGNNRSRN